MVDYARENLLRLMAGAGLSVRQVSDRTGLDERTLRGILNGGNKPHVQTLHRLADGLGVKIDEFFVDPAQLLYRRFDQQTNPVVAEVIETHGELFEGWTEADFDELHSRVGTGGPLTAEGTLEAVHQMNHKHELHQALDLLMESSFANVASNFLGALYQELAVQSGWPKLKTYKTTTH
jgi:transcriptional regulator with XRE-family HTH domain